MSDLLRAWQLTDTERLATLANDAEIARYMTDGFPHPYHREHALEFIKMAAGHHPVRFFAILFEGQTAGGIGIHPQADIMRKNAELGYWINKAFWGKGLATKAVRQMVSYGFAHFDIDRIYARPFGSNAGSQRVLEKAGFTFEGRFEKTIFKNGVYEDELFYALRRPG